MAVACSIEIAAPPEAVRAKFLNFSQMHTYHTAFFASITPLTTLSPPSTIRVTFAGNFSMDARIERNDPDCFTWAGSVPLLFGGTHSFRFSPSEKIPGGTTFSQDEYFYGALGFLMGDNFVGRCVGGPEKTRRNWDGFNRDLKRACEAREVME